MYNLVKIQRKHIPFFKFQSSKGTAERNNPGLHNIYMNI